MDEEVEIGEHTAYVEAYDTQDHLEQALEEEVVIQAVVVGADYMEDED